MIFKKCCFFLPLNVGCTIIGAIFITFHVGELITHSDDTIFIRQVSHKVWAPVIMSPILTIGTLSSVLLVYAASKALSSWPLPNPLRLYWPFRWSSQLVWLIPC
ncbi:uncharacterized protein LOC122615022 isoform X2 [Drosophila teissieri]|uniref:uncharacterized protein LOC122615022 isoform X2 n=1 Tax=Drosophila teissieri TaxID=7243 RepID=UPI001CBA3F13|nr:uncharacterized protein LOC122615022 isoform X2 [Drosophila teissieri]